jgi:Mce-associated membrane protein
MTEPSNPPTEPTPATIEPAGPAPHGSPPWASLSIGLAVVMVILLVVISALLSSQTSKNGNTAAASPAYLLGASAHAAQDAAVAEVKATLTYNYKTLDANFAAAERGLTPSFRVSYSHTTETSVRPLASKYHAISTASVAAAGVSAASENAATLLLFVDQTVQNTQLPHPRLDRSRIRVSMVRTNGHWLINHLAPL